MQNWSRSWSAAQNITSGVCLGQYGSVELVIKSVFCDFDGRKKRELLSLRLLLFFVCFSSLKNFFLSGKSPQSCDE